MRLFREQGFDATTIEQIAEAADVSPSTFFRYFPTKEEVVVYDAFDPRVAEAFRAQSGELSVIEALRRAIMATFTGLPEDELESLRERESLLTTVPELRGRMLDEFVRSMDLIIELVAERAGRPVDDPAVRSLAGAVIGVSISAWLDRSEVSESDAFFSAVDAGLQRLETGFGL